MGRDMSIFQIGESPYQYGVHSNLGTNISFSPPIESPSFSDLSLPIPTQRDALLLGPGFFTENRKNFPG